MKRDNRQWWWLALPGLLWMLARVVFLLIPPASVMAGGHPDLTYNPWAFAHYSYSDVVALYGSRHLFAHRIPYFQNTIEYPVILGLYMSLMAYFPGFGGYLAASVLGLMAAYLIAFWALWSRRGPLTALWFSLSPLLLTYGLLNWDLLGIATWGLGILAYEKGQYRASGLWLGAGVATKFFPIVAIPYLGAALWRAQKRGQRRYLKSFLTGAAITGVGINLPFALFAFPGWSYFFTYNSGRPPDPGIYQWLSHLHLLTIASTNLVSLLLTVIGGAILLIAVLKGQLSGIWAAGAGLSWWILCNKVYSPQYMLWVYYALLWMEVNPVKLLLANFAGLFDFWMAMRWLTLGSTGSPFLASFVASVPLPVISLRDAVLAWAALTPLSGNRDREVPDLSPSSSPTPR